jgi:hypothetical protein
MDYALAKQLRDAGFRFTKIDGADSGRSDVITFDELPSYHFALPTLEELIEACGDKFGSLERDTDLGFEKEWHWTAIPIDGAGTFGPTPTEAVARLWLALHSSV